MRVAFDAFVTSVKIPRPKDLPKEMKEALKFCELNSLQPLLPAFNELAPAYEGHTSYSMVPPDLMHTYIGLLESWISMTLVVIALIRREYPEYKRNVAHLEEKLAKFPFKQAMPFKEKHFNRGLTIYVPGLDSNLSKKETGYGELKLIDYKDVFPISPFKKLNRC